MHKGHGASIHEYVHPLFWTRTCMFHTFSYRMGLCLEKGQILLVCPCECRNVQNLQDNEIFGPVLACVEADSFDEAIKFVNEQLATMLLLEN